MFKISGQQGATPATSYTAKAIAGTWQASGLCYSKMQQKPYDTWRSKADTYAEMMKKLPHVLQKLGYPCYQEVKDTLLCSYLLFLSKQGCLTSNFHCQATKKLYTGHLHFTGSEYEAPFSFSLSTAYLLSLHTPWSKLPVCMSICWRRLLA